MCPHLDALLVRGRERKRGRLPEQPPPSPHREGERAGEALQGRWGRAHGSIYQPQGGVLFGAVTTDAPARLEKGPFPEEGEGRAKGALDPEARARASKPASERV